MNDGQLNNLEALEGKQLVLRISGAVESSNMTEFEETALAVIASINTDLQTDDDFAEAEANVKSCQLIETRIHNARQDAINSTAAIATLIATTEKLEAKFRETRLLLNRLVKTEKEARKNDILSGAKNHIAGMLIKSPVKHGFIIDNKAIMEAAKNKRSLDKMREAVSEVVEEETLRLADLEETFLTNMEAIQAAEAQYPGIFPDKQNVSLSPVDVVAAQIESRIANFRYNLEMKAKREKEDLERKETEAKRQAETKEAPPVAPPYPVNIPTPPVFPDPFSDAPTMRTLIVLISSPDPDEVERKIAETDGVLSVVQQ
jgi:hypothetical protein